MFNDREKKLLRRALTLYAGEHVVSRVLREGDKFLVPSIEPAMLTMLFFRCSFNTVDEKTTHETMFAWQRAYAEAMTQGVVAFAGTIDTFVGDDGSAWWNAKDRTDHADRAVGCGLALLKAIDDVNRLSPSFPQTSLRIGIHTGHVGLGNYGSTIWLRYCPMGDTVNIAAWLRSAEPYTPSPIIVSGDTYDLLRDRTAMSELGDLVKLIPGARFRAYGIRREGDHAT